MKVAVIGAGKMGLPLACRFAELGADVLACDLRSAVIDEINAGRCPIDEVGVPELLSAAVAAGRLRGTTDTLAAVRESEVVVVIVPALLTPDRDVDMSALVSVSAQIARVLRPGMMVSFETTVPIGGTAKFLKPVLEQSGLKAGVDFDLVYSPERVKSQRVLAHLTKTPKVVGGVTPASAERGARFYGEFLGAPVMNVGTMEAAEMVKVGGMVYRDVNIALANELARYAVAASVDLTAVISAINTDGEAHLLDPGIGVGGHCTPVYPYFLIRDAERRSTPVTLASRARRVNEAQVSDTLDRVERLTGPLAGRRVLILGLAFRPRVKEYILSPAFNLKDELSARGADVVLHDPLYTDAEIEAHGFVPAAFDSAPAPDVVILQTAHPEYEALDFAQMARAGVRVIVDGRNMWTPADVRQWGMRYIGIGRPDDTTTTAQAPQIPIARPELGAEEAEAAADVVRSGWILQGPEVAALEREFAAMVGAPHACAVANGTAALHLALRAAGVGQGDEVITVSHSFIATANAVRYCGAIPVFVDIDRRTFNIDPERVARALTARTRAILIVHQMGMPADLAALVALGRRHGVPIVEDAACAAGSQILWNGAWEPIGRPQGDIACFSFHPRKVMTTGEGGMITTANAAWDEKCRRWRQHGMTAPGSSEHVVVGYNYRMTDIQAAMGRAQLKRLPRIVEQRRALARSYHELLAAEGLDPAYEPSWARSNWQSYCVWLPEDVDQARVIEALRADGIASKGGIVCAHLQPAYEQEPWLCGIGDGGRATTACGSLGVSEEAQQRTIMLPLYPQMTVDEQRRVVAALARAVKAVPAEKLAGVRRF
jgi:nucleotide sugar dehydrogenase